MFEISLEKNSEGFESFKNFLLGDRLSFLKGEAMRESNRITLALLDRDILFERSPLENTLSLKDNLPLFKVYYPSDLSSRESGRFGKTILFPKGELMICYSRFFKNESLAKRDWIINEIPYTTINTILRLTEHAASQDLQLKGHTVLYKNRKILGEETFYNSSSVLFDCQIHLNWEQNSWDLYNSYCSEFKSIYEKGSLLQLLNVSEEHFLEVFIEELEHLECFIDIIE